LAIRPYSAKCRPERGGAAVASEDAQQVVGAAAGLDPADEDYRERLTRFICDYLGLPALHRDVVAPDRAVLAAYF
jgi:hypothetical protein